MLTSTDLVRNHSELNTIAKKELIKTLNIYLMMALKITLNINWMAPK